MLLLRATTADDLVHLYPSHANTDIICRRGIHISIILHHLLYASQIFQVICNIIHNERVRSTKSVFCGSAFFHQRYASSSQWFYAQKPLAK